MVKEYQIFAQIALKQPAPPSSTARRERIEDPHLEAPETRYGTGHMHEGGPRDTHSAHTQAQHATCDARRAPAVCSAIVQRSGAGGKSGCAREAEGPPSPPSPSIHHIPPIRRRTRGQIEAIRPLLHHLAVLGSLGSSSAALERPADKVIWAVSW